MPMFVLFVSAGVLFEAGFPLWVSLINFCSSGSRQKSYSFMKISVEIEVNEVA